MKKTVTLLSFHHYLSKRKAGFHWIANSFKKIGWNVNFVTTPISPFSKLINDHRWSITCKEHLNQVEKISESEKIFVYSSIFSPLSQTNNVLIDLLSPLFIPIFKGRLSENLKELIKSSDIVIFESTAGILLFDQIKDVNPQAKIIYRVSDSLDILRVHPSIIDYESKKAPEFDLISVPSRSLMVRFTANPANKVNLQFHGIDKKIFLNKSPSPENYSKYNKNLVFIGNSFFDLNFITIAAGLFPEYGFHLIGPIEYVAPTSNITLYGEIPFSDTIPFLLHADVGLQIRKMDIGLETLSDSLKILQYTWCKLPIIAPLEMKSTRDHVIGYLYDIPESIFNAVNLAIEYDRSRIDSSDVMDWDEIVQEMIAQVRKPNVTK